MTSRRLAGVCVGCVWAALVTALVLPPSLWADGSQKDLREQQEKQKQIQAETERMARRLEAMIQVLEYYHLDKSAEKKMLDEMERTLGSLSREQMTEVLAHLEAAAKAPDPKLSEQEREQARARHNEIILNLKGLLARYDAVKDLDQAAERLDKAVNSQVKLYLSNVEFARESEERLELGKNAARHFNRKLDFTVKQATEQADAQAFLQRDVADTLQQVGALKAQLAAEQAERVGQVEVLGREHNLLESLSTAARELRATGSTEKRRPSWQVAAERQWQAAGELDEMARTLRAPHDKLAVLHEARERVAHAIQDQEALHQQTQLTPEPPAEAKKDVLDPPANVRGQAAANARLEAQMAAEARYDQETRQARDLADRQGWLEHETRSLRTLLKPHAAEVADQIPRAEKAMQEAQQAVRKKTPADALKPQDEAVVILRVVLSDLDRLILETEKDKIDPVTALKKAAEAVDRLIKEQKDAEEKAEEATKDKQPERLPRLTPKQQDLARRTDEVKALPMPTKPETQAALEKAARSMDKAAASLKDKQGDEAVSKQNEAIKSLEEAKKHLDEQIAEVEKRRDDITALEKAAKHLDELTRKEEKVAADTHHEATKNKPQDPKGDKDKKDNKELAKQQGELTPQTKELGKEIEQAAPEAANHLDKGADHMEAAKKDLDGKQLPNAARQADKAVDKLKDAQKALAKAIDAKKAQEIADQAAMQPDKVNPANAAEQVAKAIEQAREAESQSKDAANQLKPNAPKPAAKPSSLADLQKQVAKKAAELGLADANKPAEDAAKALEKGNLDKAVEQQKKALGKLQAAAKEPGKPEASPKKPEASSPAEAKNPADLAKAQEALLKATQAQAKSQTANEAAKAALGQARAQAPQGVQPQLEAAGKELDKAGQQLNQGSPAEASQAQGQAVAQLEKALDGLNGALAAMGQPPAQPGQPSTAMASSTPPGQAPTPQPGPAQSPQPAPSPEKNEGKATGMRQADGRENNTASEHNGVKGEGAFLYLPPQQRDKIRQALSEKLPPEYAAMIQQYYVNLARGKAPAKPAPQKR